MSRVERVGMLLRQIEHETKVAFDEHGELLCRNARLKAENAKLRELCGEMLLYIAYPYVCVRPSVLVERARELGIETDE